MQSAIGRIQLRRLAQWQAARRRNAEAIYQAAGTCPALRVPEVPGHIDYAWYKCYLFVRPQRLAPGWDRDRIMAAINDQGVPCYSGSCSEIYLEKAFEGEGDEERGARGKGARDEGRGGRKKPKAWEAVARC